jgi:hypothetical protein
MAEAKTPPVPAGPKRSGRALWRSIVGGYDLRPDELRLLEDACRTADVADALEAALVGEPLTLPGVKDQPRAHPLMVELRQQRLALAGMLKQLRLPETPGEARTSAGAGARSVKSRQAANTRWHQSGTGLGGLC